MPSHKFQRVFAEEADFPCSMKRKAERQWSKAQLEDWNSNTLLGALLFLKEREADVQLLEEWAYRGGSAFNEGKNKNVSS